MLYKQLQLFQLTESFRFSKEEWIEKLSPLAFNPCLPSLPSSAGWISPIDEEQSSLVHLVNDCIMLCMQIEEKVLPTAVIRQELEKKTKEIEQNEGRKIYKSEKLRLKDELTTQLLIRAFTKINRVHAYIDIKNNWLVLGTTHAKKTEQFISLFKKSISENVNGFKFSKLSSLFTNWIKTEEYPTHFVVEKNAVLQDPQLQKRIIRCREQNLFSSGIQSLIKEGCEVTQLALSWNDRVQFVLTDNFLVSNIQFLENVFAESDYSEADTKLLKFNADSLILTNLISAILKDLLALFIKNYNNESKKSSISPHLVA